MERFMVCDNPGCRFILDRRINGKSRDSAQLVLKKCPLPHSVCCDRSASGKSRAA
jgi:hypothetical protein